MHLECRQGRIYKGLLNNLHQPLEWTGCWTRSPSHRSSCHVPSSCHRIELRTFWSYPQLWHGSHLSFHPSSWFTTTELGFPTWLKAEIPNKTHILISSQACSEGVLQITLLRDSSSCPNLYPHALLITAGIAEYPEPVTVGGTKPTICGCHCWGLHTPVGPLPPESARAAPVTQQWQRPHGPLITFPAPVGFYQNASKHSWRANWSPEMSGMVLHIPNLKTSRGCNSVHGLRFLDFTFLFLMSISFFLVTHCRHLPIF